jgi:hypothetical protein
MASIQKTCLQNQNYLLNQLFVYIAKLLLEENDVGKYNYIKQSNRIIDGVDDAQEYAKLKVYRMCILRYYFFVLT